MSENGVTFITLLLVGPLTQRARPMDWAYVVDSSDSVDWNLWRRYVSENAQRYFKVSDEKYRVGLITYSDGARIAFPFNTAEIWDLLIERTPQQGGSGRRIDLALQRARDELFTPRLGARADARKVHVYHVMFFCSTLQTEICKSVLCLFIACAIKEESYPYTVV